MNIKVIGLLGALALLAPVGAAVAAPASGLTAHAYSDLATAPQAASNAAVVPGDATAKVEKVWWRGRGFGWRGGYGFRRFGFGYRRPFFGYYRRPFFRRRFFYY